MSAALDIDWKALYATFEAPITRYDCGKQCAPLSDSGDPFCCTTEHTIPVVFYEEWQYLSAKTELWHIYAPEDKTRRDLAESAGDGLLALECLGWEQCERDYRSLACRTFPFYPYVSREGEFLGLSYYWAYEDRCWVISHLELITDDYLQQFVAVYDQLFAAVSSELEDYRRYSATARRVFSRWKRSIPLLHRDGATYAINPTTAALTPTDAVDFGRHGPYLLEFETFEK